MTVSSLLTKEYLFDRRSFLPLKSDFLWLLETGVVRTLTVLEDGTSITLGLWGSGDVVGRVLSQADPYQIECLTPVKATLLPERRWHEATDAMILHIQRSGEFMEILHHKQAESSLLRLLLG
jgi:CRP-like cAMP-binding protein